LQEIKTVDVLVIGGGINGAGIARDLAGRGVSVLLCEKDDLAGATSSASTKLIHGGLRYLEHMAFRMVREALMEREVLLHAAPHIISPMTFILPHHRDLRPWWLIRLGLFLYDRLGGRGTLPASSGIAFAGTKYGQPLKLEYRRGFSYADCWVDDARLVALAALDAHEKGAEILTRTECVALAPATEGGGWEAVLLDAITGQNIPVRAKAIVNAAGPWVMKVLGLAGGKAEPQHKIRWVKGSHIIIPRIYQGKHAYILQNDDKRIVFAIPYEEKFTLIGTTDVDYTGDIEEVRIEFNEVEYLCAAFNKYFRQQIKPENVEWTYSGVRALLDDGKGNSSEVTRDYLLEIEEDRGAPLLNVYGGKLTAFRKLSEQAGDMMIKALGKGKGAWTKTAPLPGGEGAGANFDIFLKTLRREYSWVPEPLAHRYARSYGTRARHILRGAKKLSDLGAHLGENIYEAEIAYLVNTEWALTVDDILWRRSKLGLHLLPETQENIAAALKNILEAKAA